MFKISRGRKYFLTYIITVSIIAVVNYIIGDTNIKNTLDTLELLKISVMIGVVFLLFYMDVGNSDTKKHSKKKKK